mmetsp:Transcript_88065/g.174765  ORF Transcript_88065/g.174765 Transcript_88065/m.174765 type:complete len:481 (+) Transcript_88065:67-1509(+)|eukprot:CAMPEP_0172728654 /NCGR_PEP_ID=MMETSP1074-20121228/92361_1 /TAXON_ID=2916 /ORGANISM="Ceratium fusus, Strain PA161109" /LENGTH=480 /DNA_ID=CAMNT_0013555923 /DNA_START=56 /DNA_END=1498 /DNA_ORIENTATION=+
MLGRLYVLVPQEKRKYAGKAMAFLITWLAYSIVSAARQCNAVAKAPLSDKTTGWAPFQGKDSDELLGYIDTSFMAAYTIGMPFMGRLADRVNVSLFLGLTMIGGAVCLCLVGLARSWSIHNAYYFYMVTFFCGLMQSAAFPCALAPLSNWFGKTKMGTTIGFWASSSPIGNIIGKTLCTFCLARWAWPQVYYVPALVVTCTAVLVMLFLVPDPYHVQLLRPGEARQIRQTQEGGAARTADDLIAARHRETQEEELVPLGQLLRLPSLIAYCAALLFAKLVYYAFTNWLTFYLTTIGFSEDRAGYMSTLFDWGGFVGGIAGGAISDKLGSRGVVCTLFQLAACVLTYVYMACAPSAGYGGNMAILFVLGACISTPYNLISSVASIDLGRHPLLQGNSKAKATIIGILDGTGSFGACVQGILVGFIKTNWGWDAVFYALIFISFVSACAMISPARTEMRARNRNVNQVLPFLEDTSQSKSAS